MPGPRSAADEPPDQRQGPIRATLECYPAGVNLQLSRVDIVANDATAAGGGNEADCSQVPTLAEPSSKSKTSLGRPARSGGRAWRELGRGSIED